MRLPYQWLKEFVDLTLSPKEAAYLLTQLGLEVEAQEEIWESPVFEIKVTPQRGDCLCALGAARELAAALKLPLKTPAPQFTEAGAPITDSATVVIEAPDLCPRYSARLIRGVKLGLSPGWMRQRLEQCGVRPISNVVDVTNLVMMELNQPLHAFDADLLKPTAGGKLPAIIVRRARPGETIMSLDGEERALTPEMLVIADGERGVAIAGVMGGRNSEVHDGTVNVLLESAHFLPASIRRTSKALGLSTEASYRFERRVDPLGTVAALDRAAELIVQLAGGEIASGVLDVIPNPIVQPTSRLRTHRVNALLGTELSVEQMAEYLGRLEIKVEIRGCDMEVTPPSFRGDLAIEEDYAEEVARLHGYDNIPSRMVATGATGGKLAPTLALEAEARKILLACGLDEALNFSLEGPEEMKLAGFPPDHPLCQAVILKNPKVEEHSRLRTSMIPTMLGLLTNNWRRGLREVRTFEVGRIYLPHAGEALADERLTVGIALMTGPHVPGWGKERIDFYALKGAVESLFDSLGLEGVAYAPLEHPSFAPGRAAQALLGDKVLAVMGEVRASVLAYHDLPKDTFLAEIDLESLLSMERKDAAYKPISRLPAIQRDLALLVPRNCPAEKVEAALRAQGGELLESLALFDVYEGKSLAAGYRSLAYALTFRAAERTLTETEIEELIANMEKALSALDVKIRR